MKNESYFIKNFPDYRLVRLSERDFCVLSKKKGYWEEIGNDVGNGRISVLLYGDYVRHTNLHVLVAETFVPNPEGKTVVHHIDFDPSNNDPANLMWVTMEEHAEIHHKGVKRTEDARRRMSEAQIGHTVSSDTRRKMSQKRRGRKPHWLLKAVEQWSLDGTTLIAKYESMSEAARQTGIYKQSICACCEGKVKTAGGYKWKNC